VLGSDLFRLWKDDLARVRPARRCGDGRGAVGTTVPLRASGPAVVHGSAAPPLSVRRR